MHRALIKDSNYGGAAWVHQDYPYYEGGDKLSFFIPVTRANNENGGLWFAPQSAPVHFRPHSVLHIRKAEHLRIPKFRLKVNFSTSHEASDFW